MALAPGVSALRTGDGPVPPRRRRARLLPHVHWFRFLREDPFSAHDLYACRCGQVRHGL